MKVLKVLTILEARSLKVKTQNIHCCEPHKRKKETFSWAISWQNAMKSKQCRMLNKNCSVYGLSKQYDEPANRGLHD